MNSTRGKMKGLNSYTDGGMNAGGNAKMRKVGGVLATKTSLISSVRVKNVCRIAEKKKRCCNTTCLGYDSQEVKEYDNILITQLRKGSTIELIRIDEIMN